ncbi:MAG: hypothetical protein WCL00_10870 [Bacteroidota bacterium]
MEGNIAILDLRFTNELDGTRLKRALAKFKRAPAMTASKSVNDVTNSHNCVRVTGGFRNTFVHGKFPEIRDDSRKFYH